MKKSFLVLTAMMMTLFLVNLISCSSPENNNIGSFEAPPFNAADIINGEEISFPDDLHGKVVYLNFFSVT